MPHDGIYMWDLKTTHVDLQRENRLTHDKESKLEVAKGEGVWGGVSQEPGVSLHTLLCVK